MARVPIDEGLWRVTLRRFAFTRALWPAERARLRDLVRLFLATKSLSAAGGHELDDTMRLAIAIQACILVLELGIEYFDGWEEVIVYPDEFFPEQTWTDDAGVVHTERVGRLGEAWLRGPVVLSWADVARAGDDDGVNVVIHEFAHKLDMLNGSANGFPPLHRGMNRQAWSTAFEDAFHHHGVRVRRRESTEIDPYAAESPAEFFSVASEVFFEMPDVLAATYPAVYEQMRLFYRQDPLRRDREAPVTT
jgi:Mlc titration factor MtfA (ptsG expression regulator)